ncbi:MAG: hypothetical protein AAF067_07895 [Pseudomonadota bacterium]
MMKLARPKSIIWFERLIWMSFAFFLADGLVAIYEGSDEYWFFIIGETFVVFLIWYLIVVKTKEWVCWLYLILTGVSVALMVFEMAHAQSLLVYTNLSLAYIVSALAAAVFLFRADSVIWFAEQNRLGQS